MGIFQKVYENEIKMMIIEVEIFKGYLINNYNIFLFHVSG
jgi:hypothetical protein